MAVVKVAKRDVTAVRSLMYIREIVWCSPLSNVFRLNNKKAPLLSWSTGVKNTPYNHLGLKETKSSSSAV